MAPPVALTVRNITASAPLIDSAKVAGTITDGNTFVNGPSTYLEAASTAGGTITITTPFTVGGLAIADKVVTMTGAQTIRIGPFDPAVYGDPVTFVVSVATITVAVYSLAGPGS
jgi:hypothetical protein